MRVSARRCLTGQWLVDRRSDAAKALRQGLDVTAIERSAHGRRRGKQYGVTVAPFDLTLTPPTDVTGPFDLAYCLEVAEHVPESLAEPLVQFLCRLGPIVVFTAAVPGQGGTGHINEQPADYWIERFQVHGFGAQEFILPTAGISQHWAKTSRLAFLAEGAGVASA